MKQIKQILSLVLCLVLALSVFSGCGGPSYDPLKGVETVEFTDSCGRTVTIPAQLDRVAVSGSTAQMFLMNIAPEKLIGLSASPSTSQMPYFPEELWYLPTFGQFYGTKANMNMEALIDAQPQVILDIGDKKETHADDMDRIQTQTGIPTIFIEATLDKMPEAFRTLGELLDCREQAEALAEFLDKTLQMTRENSAKLTEDQKKTVLFGTGSTGLACNGAGSVQADVIELVGAKNALVPDEVSNRNGGTTVDLEQVYVLDPDAILLAAGGPYETLKTGQWADLTAVKSDAYYEIPNLPYDWMSSPPSVNRVIGIWWLGNLLYPDLYDYDMVAVAQEFYRLFWHYDLTQEEAKAFLARSTLK